MSDSNTTLPASWYCSKRLSELEQSSIFLKAWYLLGPVTRFIGQDQVAYEISGVRFVVENGSKGLTVSRQVDGFRLPQRLTSSGLLFAAISPDAVPFEEYYPGLEDLLTRVDFTKLPFKRTLSYEGRFNWKTMVDGYQECLHCQYTHRSFSKIYPPSFYKVHNFGNYSRHIADPENPEDGLFLYFFPICTLNVYGGGMTSFRVCPTDRPGVTRMEFDYYHQQDSDSEAFERYFRFVRRVAMEDYELCERAQMNLEKGIYSRGVLNSEKESGVIHYQQLVRQKVVAQFREEKQET